MHWTHSVLCVTLGYIEAYATSAFTLEDRQDYRRRPRTRPHRPQSHNMSKNHDHLLQPIVTQKTGSGTTHMPRKRHRDTLNYGSTDTEAPAAGSPP